MILVYFHVKFIFVHLHIISNIFYLNYTVRRANVPEMLNEDYISDVDEGISSFVWFVLIAPAFFSFFHIFQLTRSSYSVFFCVIDSFHSMAVEYGFVVVARLLFMNMKFFNMQISIGLHILSLGFAILITSVHIITISHILSQISASMGRIFFIRSLGC